MNTSKEPSQQKVDAGELERVWNAALTLANNICVQISDRYNNDDQTDEAHAANECAKEIRSAIGKLSEFADDLQLQQPADKWVSVDKKPESGKNVLIYWINDNKRGRTSIGYYAAKHTVVYMDDETQSDYGEYSEEKDEYYFPEGWHENPQDIPYTSNLSNVVAWQPLPEAPSVKEK